MPSGKFFMRPGEYRGVKYGLEARQLESGEVALEAVFVGSRNALKFEEASQPWFADVEEAFRRGAEIAHQLIDGRR